MKIAIHHREGSFSDRWIAYCQKRGIPYKIVNAYASDIVEQVRDCDAFMWHHHHADSKDVQFAKQLLVALQQSGKVVFPDFNIGWHFDDKVGQKYLLEALGLPLVPSYVFYSKAEALAWCDQATYPKVFKLRGGAGSSNVRLVKKASEAKGVVRTAFGRGFRAVDRLEIARDALRKKNWIGAIKNFIGFLYPKITREYLMPRHKGYAYFQDFIPNMAFDIRVIVIGDRAFAVKRMCRKDDFRASGSGRPIYDKTELDERCVLVAFEASRMLCRNQNAASLGFDFIYGCDSRPILVEMGYGFDVHFYDPCPGFWTRDGKWHEEYFTPQHWMVDWVLEECSRRTS